MKTLLSDVDAAVLTGEFARYIVRCIRDGLAPGEQGWWDDGVADISPWGFELKSIRVPVQVWHGRKDRFVPYQHGQWLAEHVPGAEPHLGDTDGHLTLLVKKFVDVHEWLARHV
jgi:pimeloyl-ACP methyl ester carboxylesterase